MADAHSTVNYVEPNDINAFEGAIVNDGKVYSKAPSLEDLCIAMNLEVEVFPRAKQSTKGQGSEVLILCWESDTNGASKVNFMSGRRILTKGSTSDGQNPPYLTTNPSDMYLDDLVDYGTTEMVGIKSVNIEYQSGSVPVINMKLTDVRGMSMFQPAEMMRDKSYLGIKGLTSENVAQSFFQCFFRLPYPRFRIYLKGFYGKPVSYEVMCDKFDTNFNSETGDFDVSVRFIGYLYSFLTDISLDALLAAPYSDYEGKQYWQEQIEAGRFMIPDHTGQMVAMPTLYEMREKFENLNATSDKDMEVTTVEAEHDDHAEEISRLIEIRKLYQSWYTTLYNVLCDRYGNKRCHLYQTVGRDADYRGILVLVEKEAPVNMAEEALQFSDEFKRLHDSLYAAVNEYYEKGGDTAAVSNVSADFSEYTRKNLFNNFYADKNNNNQITYNGLKPNAPIAKADVVSGLLVGEDGRRDDKRYNVIYNDGVNQCIYCYYINPDYTNVKTKINSLQASANENAANGGERSINEINQRMFSMLGYYPSIENFTKVSFAHLETLMHMIFKTESKCSGRTPSQVGASIGPDGNCCDVPYDSDIVPSFPRVTKLITEQGVTKREDTWVGEFNGGQGFEPEIDLVDGLFNAIDHLDDLEHTMAVLEAQQRRMEDVSNGQATTMRYPLTSYDVFMNGNIYSNDDNFMNSASGIIGKVIARMYGILSVSSYASHEVKFPRGERQNSGSTTLIEVLGALEAENFFNSTGGIANSTVRSILLGDGSSSVDDLADKFIKLAIYGNTKNSAYDGYRDYGESKSLPWEGQLVSSNVEFTCYKKSDGSAMIPLQNYSFAKDGGDHSAKRHYDIFKKDGCEPTNDMAYTRLNSCRKFKDMYLGHVDWKCGLVFENEHNRITKLFDYASSYSNSDYRCYEVYNQFLQHARVENYQNDYKSLFRVDEASCFRKMKGEGDKNNPTGETALENYFVTALNDRTISDCTFVRAYGVDVVKSSGTVHYKPNNNIRFIDSYKGKKDSVKKVDAIGARLESFFVMSLWCFQYTKVRDYLSRDYTHFYVPKLLALQIGCALRAFFEVQKSNGIEGFDSNIASKYVVLPDGFKEGLDTFLSKMPRAYKLSYVRYFDSWCKYNNNAKGILSMFNSFGDKGFQQDNEKLKNMVADLMLPICITRMTSIEDKWSTAKAVGGTPSKVFLKSFIDKMRQLQEIGYAKDEEGNVVKLSEETKQTTDVMKMELYRYLKQVRDKWIPATSIEDWKYDTFFQDTVSDSSGHCVYFIDSYYNKIGQKVLISPSEISRLIGVWLNNSDAHTSMLKMLGDMLGTSRCMFLCIQNFFDMTRGMKDTFTPIPYNEMNGMKRHPDFVVVYPYEPSKNLNIEKSDYEDDSFMLNDVFYTPIAVTSRGKDQNAFYSLPAFGVSYGRQYQSYFKKVDVGMAGAVQTQQAIFMKHQLLNAYNHADKNDKITAAQNLFDIYTTQSYTCTVHMMGCAWIQPLMYFVLLNVPMFKGSYMIMKVNHSITPGNMDTTFTGCRMANVGNHIVKNIFSDDQGASGSMTYQEDLSYEEADIDNNCPYKVYPLEDGGEGDDLSSELSKKVTNDMCFNNTKSQKLVGNTVLDAFTKIVEKESGYQSGNEDYKRCQAMLVATSLYNRLILTRTKNKGGNYSYKNLIFKQGQYDIVGASTMSPTESAREIVKNIFKNSPSWVLTQYKKTFVSYPDKSAHNRVASEITLEKLQKVFCFMNYKEGITNENKPLLALETLLVCDASKWQSSWTLPDAIMQYRYTGHYFKKGDYGDCWTPSKKDADMNKDLNELLFNAIQKSCDSTKDISITLSSATTKIDKSTYLDITQKDGKTNKLSRVFGLVLNGYYDKFDELYWITNGSDTVSDPVMVRIHAKDNATTRQIMICDKSMKGGKFTNEDFEKAKKDGGKYINEDFILSVSKKYSDLSENAKDASKELPQFVVNGKFQHKIFEKNEIGECAGCNKGGANSAEGGTNEYSAVGENLVGTKIGDWNVTKSTQWLERVSFNDYNKTPCPTIQESDKWSNKAHNFPMSPACTKKGRCWGYVKRALIFGGFKDDMGTGPACQAGPDLKRRGFKPIGTYTYQGGSRKDVAGYTKQLGDIAIFKTQSGHDYGHAAMWCGKNWISDFKQQGNWISGGLTSTFTIWRYSGQGMT